MYLIRVIIALPYLMKKNLFLGSKSDQTSSMSGRFLNNKFTNALIIYLRYWVGFFCALRFC
jgi:hypothetical protein